MTNKIILDSKVRLKRMQMIREMLPDDVSSVLDIGCGKLSKKVLKDFDYIGLDLKGADINQDLNINWKIPLPDNSVDCVILSQILEHLAYPLEIIKEAKRITKRYILLSLPNEFEIGMRFRYLLKFCVFIFLSIIQSLDQHLYFL